MSGGKAISEVIEKFMRGATEGKSANMHIDGNNLYSYYTVIAKRKSPYTILLNPKKYSSTTSKQQNMIIEMAVDNGIKIEKLIE